MGSINVKLPEELHRDVKVLSAKEGKKIPEIVINALKHYVKYLTDEEYEVETCSYEDLTPEEKKIIDEGREEYKKGECIDVETFLKETKEDED